MGSVEANLMALKIELGIYLTKVMESAELDTWEPSYGGYGREPRRPVSVKPITGRLSSPNFTHSVINRDGSGQTIGYNITGNLFQSTEVVRARIDELLKAVFKSDFYLQRGWFSTYLAEQKRAELLKAEQQLDQLGQEMDPLSVLGLNS